MERLTLDDMIKALKCVASQDTVGDCYADHENFMHMEDEHKRIVCGTGEDLRDYISGKEAIGCPYHQNTYGCCFEDGELYWLKDVAELLEELNPYKDLEEQGLLVRLPVKIGDDIYKIPSKANYDLNVLNGYKANNRVYHQKVYSIVFSQSGWFVQCDKDSIHAPNIICVDVEYGKTWFLAREEAEKKLEEMKNE
jgi:hypothetical protein